MKVGIRVALTTALVLVSAVAGAEVSQKRLQQKIERAFSRPELSAASWGVEVRSLRTGRTLYAHEAGRAFRPASTLKLLTVATALDLYGPDGRVRTTLETAGRVDAHGRLLGDLYLVGRGDPNLSSRFSPGRSTAAFEAMADALQASGVKSVEGRLVGHDGAFADERWGSAWGWEDLAWGYGAPVSALSFDDNRVEISLSPGERPGDPAILRGSSRDGCVRVVSSTLTAAASGVAVPPEETVILSRPPGSDEVAFSGSVRMGASWQGTVAVLDPARCAASVLATVLEARGIRLARGVATSREPLPPGVRAVAARESEPMGTLVATVAKESQNLHAEMLLRLAGLRHSGQGSAAAGLAAVHDLLARLGVPSAGIQLSDGSGLARTNLLTPATVVSLLAAMDRHAHAAAFRAALAVAGRDGTLRRRLAGTAAEGRVLAKTGSLAQADALAGYVTTRGGERLAFAAFVNNHAGRTREAVAALDALALALAEEP